MRTCRPGALLRSGAGALLCGVIVIGVTSSGSAAASQGDASPADSTNCSSTTPVSAGQVPVSGSIADPSAPPQCFTFDDVSGDTVFVNAVATSTNPTPGVEVVDPNGTPLSAEQDSGVIYPTDASGTYTIEVTDTSAGPFNLDFQRMDDPVGCTSVAFGEPSFTTSIASPGEALCFQISVTSTEWISIRVRKPAPIELAVFGADGSLGGYINPQNPTAPLGAGFLDGSDFGTQPLLAFVGGQSPAHHRTAADHHRRYRSPPAGGTTGNRRARLRIWFHTGRAVQGDLRDRNPESRPRAGLPGDRSTERSASLLGFHPDRGRCRGTRAPRHHDDGTNLEALRGRVFQPVVTTTICRATWCRARA